jgi:hypothetical protein
MTEAEIMRVEKAAMIRIIHEEPAFSEMFMRIFWLGPCEWTVQFQREAPGTSSSPIGEFRQGRRAGADHCKGQPRDARGHDRHHAVPRESFHEQISTIGLH